MPNLKRGLLTVAAYVSLLGAAALFPGQRAHTQGSPHPTLVTVTNTPLPVALQGTGTISGNVNIVNTPTVHAQQDGTWNVGISGTPSVNIGNSPTVTVGNSAANPVSVHDPTLSRPQPVQFTIHHPGLFGDGYTVPAGKVLAVRHVNAGFQADPSSTLVELGLQEQGLFDPAAGVPVQRGGNLGPFAGYSANADLLIFYHQGQRVIATVTLIGGSTNELGFCRILVSGYLEDEAPASG